MKDVKKHVKFALKTTSWTQKSYNIVFGQDNEVDEDLNAAEWTTLRSMPGFIE